MSSHLLPVEVNDTTQRLVNMEICWIASYYANYIRVPNHCRQTLVDLSLLSPPPCTHTYRIHPIQSILKHKHPFSEKKKSLLHPIRNVRPYKLTKIRKIPWKGPAREKSSVLSAHYPHGNNKRQFTPRYLDKICLLETQRLANKCVSRTR